MKTITGHVTVVQEQRFRLETDDGRNFLLNGGKGDTDLLCDLMRRRARVVVEYDGEPNLTSGVVRRIEILSSER